MSAATSHLDLDELRARYLRAQLRGDRRAAAALVLDEGLARGATVPELHEHVLESAQRDIGRLWQENVVTVAQEHMATAISNFVLTRLFECAEAAPANGRRVLVACVEGELHEFPARLVTDALDLAGFSVRFLGANVPTESLLTMLGSEPPDLVALSATMTFHAPALRAAVGAIRDRFGRTLPIAVGGGAFLWSQTLATDLDAEITARNAAELVLEAARLLGVEPWKRT